VVSIGRNDLKVRPYTKGHKGIVRTPHRVMTPEPRTNAKHLLDFTDSSLKLGA